MYKISDKEKKNFYNDLIDLFDWVYEDPSKVNMACKKIFDKMEFFIQDSYEEGYDKGYIDCQEEYGI